MRLELNLGFSDWVMQNDANANILQRQNTKVKREKL